MKKTTSLFSNLLLCSFLIGAAGCTDIKDIYDPDYNPIPPTDNVLGIEAPDGFDWSMMTSAKISVTVDDQYDGNYHYLVAIYDANPLFVSSATQLAGGMAKQGEPFSTVLDLPQGLTALYVCQTSPQGERSVKVVSVQGQSLSCHFGQTSKQSTRAINISTRTTNYDDLKKEVFASELPAGCHEATGGNDVQNGPILLPNGANYTKINNWTSGVSIYIQGEVKAKNLYLASNSRIYLLPGAKLTVTSLTDLSQTNTFISVPKGATLEAQDFTLGNGFSLYNEGTVNVLDDLTFSGGGHFYNWGMVNVTGETLIGSKLSKLEQLGGTFTTQDMEIRDWNLSLSSSAILIVKDELELHESLVEIKGASSLRCKDFSMNNSRIELGEGCLLHVEGEADLLYNGHGNDGKPAGIYGLGDTQSFVRLANIEEVDNIHFSNILVSCSNMTEEAAKEFDEYSQDEKTIWTEFYVPVTDVNEGYGAPNPDKPTEPENPADDINAGTYTYAFEDQWPVLGDYDVNDVVIQINKLIYTPESKNNSNIRTFTIEGSICAAGARKNIAVALQLDGISANGTIQEVELAQKGNPGFTADFFKLSANNTEQGQDHAVIPICSNVHDFLMNKSGSVKEFINTSRGGTSANKKEFKITVHFTTPVQKSTIMISKLNLFIITDSNNSNRTEVHVAGFDHTNLQNVGLLQQGNNDPDKKYLSHENLAWGIMIPSNFNWPLEGKIITKGYSLFKQWLTSGGSSNADWYETKNNEFLY